MVCRLAHRIIVAGVVLGCLGIVTPVESVRTDRSPQLAVSDDPRPESVVLRTRVVDQLGLGILALELASAPDLKKVISTRKLDVDSWWDGVVKLRIDGLDPGMTCWYRFLHGSGAAMGNSPIDQGSFAGAIAVDEPTRRALPGDDGEKFPKELEAAVEGARSDVEQMLEFLGIVRSGDAF